MNSINLFTFQKDTVERLEQFLSNPNSKEVIKLKAPTGSGKTIILLALIESYLRDHQNTSFIWFCPGEGGLETQSMKKMRMYLPQYQALTLSQSLVDSFLRGRKTVPEIHENCWRRRVMRGFNLSKAAQEIV